MQNSETDSVDCDGNTSTFVEGVDFSSFERLTVHFLGWQNLVGAAVGLHDQQRRTGAAQGRVDRVEGGLVEQLGEHRLDPGLGNSTDLAGGGAPPPRDLP